uniref:exodeoxyribonuclease III n=1 Tax=Neogobius melanostomus TaxID=47308 RepID=A0A8C6SQK6_9GOBI
MAAAEASPDEALIQSLEIMTWNVNGVKSKKDEIIPRLKELDKDIYLIQETRSSRTELNLLSIENYQTHHAHYTNPKTGRSQRGVAILIKKEIPFTFNSKERDSEGRYLIVRGEYGGAELTLVNIYAPASRKDRPKFFKNIFEKLKGSTNIIMGGDFNLVMDRFMDSANTDKQRKPRSNALIKDYMETCDLCDIWRQRNPDSKEYTCRSVSRIDYFLISKSLREHVTGCEILEIKISDHYPVVLKLCGPDVFLIKLPRLRDGGGAWISAFVNLITGHTLTLGHIRTGLKGHIMEKLEEELETTEEPDHTPFHTYLEDLWDILRDKYPTTITQVKWRKGESGADYLQRVKDLWVQQSGTDLNDQTKVRYRRAVEAGCPKPVRNKLRETRGLSSMLLEEWEEHVCRHINDYNENETQESQLLSGFAKLNLQTERTSERKVMTQKQTSSDVAIIKDSPVTQRLTSVQGPYQVENRRCYNCRNVGHISRYCPESRNGGSRNNNYHGNRRRGWRQNRN